MNTLKDRLDDELSAFWVWLTSPISLASFVVQIVIITLLTIGAAAVIYNACNCH